MILFLLLLFDFIYIGFQLTQFKKIYNTIQGAPLHINLIGAGLCYLLLTFILYYYIILPKKTVKDAFILGFCIYGVYDTTTYALLKDYPASMAIMDTLWGGTLFAAVTLSYNYLSKLK